MVDLITVCAGLNDGRIAIWDRHPDHPGGELILAGDGSEARAARTPAVLRALADGRLVEVEAVADRTPREVPKGSKVPEGGEVSKGGKSGKSPQ